MDELQNDEVTEDVTDEVIDEGNESETGETGAELAPAPEDKQDKIDGAQKAINKQHAKYREEERKRIAAEDEARKLKEKLDAIEAEKGDVIVPPAPDPYDEDYEEKLKARDDAIARKAAQDAQKQVLTEQQKENEAVAAKNETERQTALVKGFDSRIVKLGLEPGEVLSAVNVLRDYGISGQLGEFILEHEDGPLITKYLADNPIELDELRNMSPISAAMRIESSVKTEAAKMKPQASSAPEPAEVLSGRGAGEKTSPHIKGARFE